MTAPSWRDRWNADTEATELRARVVAAVRAYLRGASARTIIEILTLPAAGRGKRLS